MSQAPFRKFINPKKNSKVKEELRQEKKKAKKERAEYFEKVKKEQYEQRMAKKAALTAGKGVPRQAAKKTGTKQDPSSVSPSKKVVPSKIEEAMPLNKYLAHCGICSRRDAVTLVQEEKVKVNGKVVTEPGYKVQPDDEVIYNNKKVFVTKNLVYILINKPKDYLTTTDDPQGRKTVLQLIDKATDERVYPIGRLDRNTSGVLLMTNDGDLTQQLSHPS